MYDRARDLEREIWRLGVYAPPDDLEAVREAAATVLDVGGDPAP